MNPKKLFTFLFLLFILPFANGAAFGMSDIVGNVLGNPVHRNQITSADPYDLHYELQELFVQPVLKKYYSMHKGSIEPTPMEITRFLLYCKKEHDVELAGKQHEMINRIEEIKKQLKHQQTPLPDSGDLVAELYYLQTELEPPGYDYAMYVLPHWKMQVHLYQNFGGGRILWQERGYEAFDAMHVWLKDHEKKGDFAILDPVISRSLYHFWTEINHGANLIDDQATIQKEFLQPEWLQ